MRLLGLRAFTAPLLALGFAAGGCFLPVGTAAPGSARTVGAGGFGIALYGEAPTLDLLSSGSEGSYAVAPSPTATLQVAYGLTDSLDLEAALDGQLWLFFLPLPLGGSLGARLQLVDGPRLDVAVAARAGYVGLGVTDTSGGSEWSADATYGQGSLLVQLEPTSYVRPGIALSLMPASVRLVEDGAEQGHGALAGSVTVSVTAVLHTIELAPFLNFVYFRSPSFHGEDWFTTGGLSIARRPSRRRAAPVAEAAPTPPTAPAPTGPAAPPPGPAPLH